MVDCCRFDCLDHYIIESRGGDSKTTNNVWQPKRYSKGSHFKKTLNLFIVVFRSQNSRKFYNKTPFSERILGFCAPRPKELVNVQRDHRATWICIIRLMTLLLSLVLSCQILYKDCYSINALKAAWLWRGGLTAACNGDWHVVGKEHYRIKLPKKLSCS